MKILITCILLAFCALAQSALADSAGGYDYGFDVDISNDQTDRTRIGHVVSKRAFNDHIVSRQEIRKLQESPDAWTLYILALDAIHWRDQSDSLSFYQIAGIHAVPWKAYDEVEQDTDDPASGFCHHNSVLFPTWHRAYMSFFEQVLHTEAGRISGYYGGERGPRMEEAARNFRIPFWDWAMTPEGPDDHVLPPSIAQATIEVDGPNGIQEIANPLFSYHFHPLIPQDFTNDPFNRCNMTKRTQNETLEGESDNEQVRDQMDALLPNIQQRLYQLFSNYPNYTMFSNAAYSSRTGNGDFDSVESLHDVIHTAAGMHGHMAFIWYSAFDPIFFLHHANVDRIFALWQVIYPDSWVESFPARYSTWTGRAGDLQNATTALAPFYRYDGLPTTSDDLRNTTSLGYMYPEIEALGPESSVTWASRRAKLTRELNRLYGSSSPSQLAPAMSRQGLKRGVAKSRHFKSTRQTRLAGLSWNAETSKPPPMGSVLVNSKYREWIVNVHVNKHALQSSFVIPFFLDDGPGDSSAWAKASNLIGTTSVFSGKDHVLMQDHVSSTVTLTSALVKLVADDQIQSLEPTEVVPLLQGRLKYKVQGPDSTDVDPATVDGLTISVASAKVVAPDNDTELPKWEEVETQFTLL
ncbi:uncharacterized protein MKZ38_009199 [Zalerion maritima]|uniref:tyrosinase n=1 Tax=Zalerion maritima TaxID=339359 RepID=A0AAD5RGJ3_9PEZI|nr:uncharacterized protein MKZ38_009199 [Zalerion maritima]